MSPLVDNSVLGNAVYSDECFYGTIFLTDLSNLEDFSYVIETHASCFAGALEFVNEVGAKKVVIETDADTFYLSGSIDSSLITVFKGKNQLVLGELKLSNKAVFKFPSISVVGNVFAREIETRSDHFECVKGVNLLFSSKFAITSISDIALECDIEVQKGLFLSTEYELKISGNVKSLNSAYTRFEKEIGIFKISASGSLSSDRVVVLGDYVAGIIEGIIEAAEEIVLNIGSLEIGKESKSAAKVISEKDIDIYLHKESGYFGHYGVLAAKNGLLEIKMYRPFSTNTALSL